MPELLVTGASGFIASAVRERLRSCPEFHVHTLSVRGDAWRKEDFSRYDAILHTAGIAHVSENASLTEAYRTVNFELTRDLARKARREGVSHFVFLSSMIVFGEATPAGVHRDVDANTPPAPAGAYGQSKLDAENALRALESPDFRVAILRPPMVYGRGCKGNYNALVRLSKALFVFPEFKNRRSMIHIDNLVSVIVRILETGASGTFHPRDGEPKSVSEIVRAVCRAHGKKMRFSRALSPMVRLFGRRGIVRRAFGDMAYASDMPDFPENYRVVGFEEAVRRTEGTEKW